MTNDELSAKVAVARGCSDAYTCFVKSTCLASDHCIVCLESYSKPYATDMNAAMELEREMVDAGLVVQQTAWPDGAVGVCVYEYDTAGGCMFPTEMVAGFVETTKPAALSKAYLAFKGVAL